MFTLGKLPPFSGKREPCGFPLKCPGSPSQPCSPGGLQKRRSFNSDEASVGYLALPSHVNYRELNNEGESRKMNEASDDIRLVPCVPGARYTGALGRAGGDFVGWGAVLSGRDPTDKKNSTLEKIEKKLWGFVFRRGFKKCVFVRKQSDFSSSSALGAPYRGRAH